MNRCVFISLLSVLLLIGCARHLSPIREPMLAQPVSAELWELRIVHHDIPKFSGVMGLQKRDGGVYCVVLDATGVPLLEGVVTSPGEMKVTRCLDELRRRRFPELMSRVVGALYLTPLEPSCPWYALVCARSVETGAGALSVVYRVGPFTGWRAECGNRGEVGWNMRVSFPWGGFDVFLEQIKDEDGVH